jgi:phosphoribosylformylglycinamidine synthase subunit PurSL
MSGTYLIEVRYKKGVADPVGRGLTADIRHLGLGKVKETRAAQLYRLVGDLKPAARTRIASDLLTDPIVQEFQEGDWHKGSAKPSPSKTDKPVVVDVWYKPGVTDAIGDSVLKGIRDLALDGVSEVRTGARYRFWGLARSAAEKLTLALLANPLVNDYVIHAD